MPHSTNSLQPIGNHHELSLHNPLPALSDSLPEGLERLLQFPDLDWTGSMRAQGMWCPQEIPVFPVGSSNYEMVVAAIAHVEAALVPATSREIVMLLARLRLHFPGQTMSEQEVGWMLEDYLQDLAVYPRDLLERACALYRRDEAQRFFPKVSQLMGLVDGFWKTRIIKLKKLRILLAWSHAKQKEMEEDKQTLSITEKEFTLWKQSLIEQDKPSLSITEEELTS